MELIYYHTLFFFLVLMSVYCDRICGRVVRVSDYSSRGPGFNSRLYQIWGLERHPLSLVRAIEELLE
jgi:hypothetical protein